MAAYCTIAEIGTLGVNADAVSDLTPVQKAAAIATVSDRMDSYFAALFTLPLVSWGQDVRECCAVLAAAKLLQTRGTGYDDSDPFWKMVGQKEKWLENIARRWVTPRVVDSSPGSKVGQPAAAGVPVIASAPSLGFSRLVRDPNGNCGGGGSFGS